MSGVRSEPAEVWLQDGRPARFVWRERLYTVLAVTRRPADPAQTPPRAGQPEAVSRPGNPYPDPPHGDHPEPDRERPSDRGPEPAGDGTKLRWRCWRVTASPGKNVPPDAYELCQDQATGRWLLSRN